MLNFNCKVMTPQGQIVKLKIEEKDKISCLKKLKRNGMTPISIEPSFKILKTKKKNTATIYSRKKKKINIGKLNINKKIINKVSLYEIREFTEDLQTLRKTGFSNKHAIITIINKTENAVLKDILIEIQKNIDEGKYIYKVMKKYNDIFPLVYRNLIKTGELTQSLDEALGYAITYLKDEEKIKNKIKNVLVPNVISFLGIMILLAIAILVVLPNIQGIFGTYGITMNLPKFITLIGKLVQIILKYWYIVVLFIGILAGVFIKYINTEKGKYKFDKFKYNNYLFGRLYYLLVFSRIIRSIFLNLQNKMRLQDALEISKNVTKNSYMISLIEKAINNVYVGKLWLDAFDDEKMLSPIILELLKKASKTKSTEILEISIKYLDKETEKEIERVLKILPEISYIAVGIALLIFIVVVLIPCMQVYLGGLLFI